MLYRKAYDKLLAWKKQKNRTALCIQGARQIAVQAGATSWGQAPGRKDKQNIKNL